ncbi:ABC transporter permease [Kroppenstedtia pulmonis]|uniref:ABC transporter permease n=1 Tax=Kroppenstedtia pulmonis TaxID=1380685 RepID=A0A7D3XK57_9BACL|nr:ABC transporter permease [Kroppenstedtia pulmonis]QKG85704.1 ABC transporter permease [Kroppenstedtia pulmonis]
MTKIRNAFLQLFLMNARVLTREKNTFFFVMIFPFIFIAIFALAANQSEGTPVSVGIAGSQSSEQMMELIHKSLKESKQFDVQKLNRSELFDKVGNQDMEVGIILGEGSKEDHNENHMEVIYHGSSKNAAEQIEGFLSRMTRPANAPPIMSRQTGGEETEFDVLKFTFPAVIIIAFAMLSIMGTSLPLIIMRQRGTLRLFALTPVNRLAFFGAQISVRFLIAVIQLILIMAYGYIIGILTIEMIPLFLFVSFMGLLMFFSFGFFLGGVMKSQEVLNGVQGILSVLMIACGIFVPFDQLPEVVVRIAKFIPLTYLGDALQQIVLSSQGIASIATDCLVLGAAALVFILLSTWTFRWEMEDEKQFKGTDRQTMKD